jgi:hypothetical protein
MRLPPIPSFDHRLVASMGPLCFRGVDTGSGSQSHLTPFLTVDRLDLGMVGSRTLTALAGLALSFLVSVVLWWQFDTLAFFLFVPFVPFLFRRGARSDPDRDDPKIRTCPVCRFETTDDAYEFCPRDGTRLEE